MGSNIHIVRGDKSLPLADFNEEQNGATLPRYVDSGKFMSILWEDCESIPTCGCIRKHDYYCDYANKCRPKDFDKLRQDTQHLNPWVQDLIDYLESEPNAYLEYD